MWGSELKTSFLPLTGKYFRRCKSEGRGNRRRLRRRRRKRSKSVKAIFRSVQRGARVSQSKVETQASKGDAQFFSSPLLRKRRSGNKLNDSS